MSEDVKPCRKCGERDRDPSGHCRPCRRTRTPIRGCLNCGGPKSPRAKRCADCARRDMNERERVRYAMDGGTYDRNRKLVKKYGVTIDGWRAQLDKQRGLCAWCHEPLPDDISKVHTDHSYKTGEFRGLTHHRCNQQEIAVIERMLERGSLADHIRYVVNPPTRRNADEIHDGAWTTAA